MCRGILTRKPRDDGVLEDKGRIALLEVSPVQPQPYEQGISIRAVVVGQKNFIELAVELGEREGRAPGTKLWAGRAYPKRGVLRGNEELGVWWRSGAGGARPVALSARSSENEEAENDR
jgi:hypothetical protein